MTRDIEQDRKLLAPLIDPALGPPENTITRWLSEALRDYMAEVERLRAELGETNEALAACQAQANGEIRRLRERLGEPIGPPIQATMDLADDFALFRLATERYVARRLAEAEASNIDKAIAENE